MKKKIFIVAAVIFSSQLQAQTISSADSVKNLDEVIVTANKFPQKQQNTGKVITVIGKDILDKSFGRSVGDILNLQSSIAVPGSNNILGSNQELYLRGSGKVLVLIDGMPDYDPSYINAGFDLNQLSVQNIERIEILQGGQSTLYGSDAVAGVINIITKKSGTKPIGLYGGFSAGSYNTYRANAAINGKTKMISYDLSYNYVDSKGFSSANDSIGKLNFDKDGFKQHAVSGSITAALSGKLQARVNGQYSHYTTGLDEAAFTDDKDYTGKLMNWLTGLSMQYKTGSGTIYLNSNYCRSERKYINDSADISGFSNYTNERYAGNTFFGELYTVQPFDKKIELLAGIDYRYQNSDQDYFSLSSFGPYKTNIGKDSVKNNMNSLFASLLLKDLSGFNIETGARFNHHSQYGNNFTFTADPSFSFNRDWKVFINVSSAFKAPSLYQLFGAGVANRKLEAERSVSYEGGAQYITKDYNFRAVYFYRTIKNAIDYDLASNVYFNNNKQKDHGLELEAGFNFKAFSLKANYSYITGEVTTSRYAFDPVNYVYTVAGDTVYNNLFRRPKHAVNVTLDYQATKKLTFSASLHAVNKRYEGQFMALPVEMKGYTTIDLYAGFQVHASVYLFADFRNITDEKYFDVPGYNSKRFNMAGGIKWAF